MKALKNCRILCVCRWGHSRSVAMAKTLHHMKIEAVSGGFQGAGPEVLQMLSAWADVILPMLLPADTALINLRVNTDKMYLDCRTRIIPSCSTCAAKTSMR